MSAAVKLSTSTPPSPPKDPLFALPLGTFRACRILGQGGSGIGGRGRSAARGGDGFGGHGGLRMASGRTQAAVVHLERVGIDGARLDNVDAMVFKSGLTVSILGMSYLKRLSRMDVRGDSMRLED